MQRQPEVLPAVRQPPASCCNRFLIVSNMEVADPSQHRRRQPARGAPAPVRCPLLLRAGPQAAAGAPRVVKLGSGGLSQQARLAWATGSSACPTWPRKIAGLHGRRRERWPTAPRVLSKADLVTDMVGEFPELQGTMGRYYAQARRRAADGGPGHRAALPPALRRRRAARHQHRPARWRWPTSSTPWSASSASASCPPATKDPFGLRRAALGVLRILMEAPLPLDLPR